MAVTLNIQCTQKHESRQAHPDHHPLTKNQIGELLAMSASGRADHYAIQQRLLYGIKGMMCPIPAHGPVAEKETELYIAFESNKGKVFPELVNRIDRILNH